MQEVQICGPTINPSDWKARSRKELLILQACCYALPFLFACVQRTQCEPPSIRVYSGASTERNGSELGMEGTKMMWTSRTEVEVLEASRAPQESDECQDVPCLFVVVHYLMFAAFPVSVVTEDFPQMITQHVSSSPADGDYSLVPRCTYHSHPLLACRLTCNQKDSFSKPAACRTTLGLSSIPKSRSISSVNSSS